MQGRLYDILKGATPYVRMEASNLRFDLVAYVPEGGKVGLGQAEFCCEHRTKTKYCKIMVEALQEEFDISRERGWINDEYQAMRQVADRGHNYGPWVEKQGYLQSPFSQEEQFALEQGDQVARELAWNYPRYRMGDVYYMDTGGLWAGIKGMCVCLSEGCPSAHHAQWAEKTYTLEKGLHCFEVKGDLDNFDRLGHQILQMQYYADYAWLVLGEKQTIPPWLPSYIGVLKFNRKENNFKRIRAPDHLRYREWDMHTQVLEDHECKFVNPADKYWVRELLRKWAINSLFRWEFGEEIVLDMTMELERLGELKTRIAKHGADKAQKSILDGDW